VATDTLATKQNKFKRTLELNGQCNICGNQTEDAHHATVSCTKATAFRHEIRESWNLPSERLFRYTGNDWLQILLSQIGEKDRDRTLLVLWRSWHLRNDIIHGEGRESIQSSINFLESFYNTTRKHQTADSQRPCKLHVESPASCSDNLTRANPVPCWSKPPVGWIKLNTDASYHHHNGEAGAGVVARDDQGRLLFAACTSLKGCNSPEDAETKAALFGISLVEDRQRTNCFLETDCVAVANKLRSNQPDRSTSWATADKIKEQLKLFDNYQVGHIRRESNRVADALARHGSSAGQMTWRAEWPEFIIPLVTQDLYPSTSNGI
jgi:ribonuclease HI